MIISRTRLRMTRSWVARLEGSIVLGGLLSVANPRYIQRNRKPHDAGGFVPACRISRTRRISACVWTTRVSTNDAATRSGSALFLHPAVTGGLASTLGAGLAGALNFSTNLLLAQERFLGLDRYGTYTVLLGLLSLVSVITAALELAVARLVAGLKEDGERGDASGVIRSYFSIAVRVGGLSALGLVGLLSLFMRRFGLAPAEIVLLAVLVCVAPVLAVAYGALQGRLRFGLLALVGVGGALARLLLSVIVVSRGGGLVGALAALIAAAGGALLVLGAVLARDVSLWSVVPAPARATHPPVSLAPLTVALLSVTGFLTIDVFAARAFLPPAVAGQYGGLAMLARVIYFLTLPLATVMFPLVSQETASPSARLRGSLRLTSAMMVGLTATLLALAVAFPRSVVGFFLGSAYLPAAGFFPRVALFVTLVAYGAWALRALLSARARRVLLAPPVFLGVQGILLMQFHASIGEILWASTIAAGGFAASMLVALSVRVRVPQGPWHT